MYYDDDPMADLEAIETQRMDARIEQAEMEQMGHMVDAALAAGRCIHGSAVGYLSPPVYPAQEGLKAGQLRCTSGCGTVFDSDEDWYAAMDDALIGD